MELTAEQKQFISVLEAKIDEKIGNIDTMNAEQVKVEAKALLDAFKEEQPELKDNEVITSMLRTIDAMKLEGKAKKPVSLEAEIESSKDDIKAVRLGAKESVEIYAASTVRTSISDNEYSENLTDIGQLAHKKLVMYDIMRKFPMSGNNDNGVVRYTDWDASTTVRAAAAVLEGALFPESTAKWEQKTVSLTKIGDTIPLSEELMEDSQAFANELNDFLHTNVQIKENESLTTSFIAAAPAYTPVAAGISAASVYDLAVVVKNAISTPYGSKYNPDFLMAPNSVIQGMKLEKDNTGNYVMPPFVDASGNVVDGLRVIENNDMAVNTLAIGDSRYMRLYEKKGIVLSKGEVDAQFAEDMITLKARKRELFLIREVDKTGFLKVTDVAAALVTIGS